MNRVIYCLLAAVLLAHCAGCGANSFATVPVSGTVTLDGQPLADATVMFLPKAAAGQEAGPPSSGTTDAQGNFTLETADQSGAIVGQHTVMITTVSDTAEATSDDEEEAEDDNVYAESNPEKVPARYNTASTLIFDVPAGGTDSANFELTSQRDEADAHMSGGGEYDEGS